VSQFTPKTNAETSLEVLFAMARNPPRSNSSDAGPLPAASDSGEPGAGASAPDEDTENTDTVLSEKLAVASSCPRAGPAMQHPLNWASRGVLPVANGDPGTGASDPSEDTENIDTSLEALFATARNSGPGAAVNGANATDWGLLPVANGDPGTGVSDPSEDTENIDTLLEALFATARNSPPGLSVPSGGLNATDWGCYRSRTGIPAPASATRPARTQRTPTPCHRPDWPRPAAGHLG
jgi:hypothetical protein